MAAVDGSNRSILSLPTPVGHGLRPGESSNPPSLELICAERRLCWLWDSTEMVEVERSEGGGNVPFAEVFSDDKGGVEAVGLLFTAGAAE